MRRFGREDDFEGSLRRHRAQPRAELLEALQARADDAKFRRGRRARVGFAAALTAGGLAALASVGGLSYAATATHEAVSAVQHVVAPKTVKKASHAAVQLVGLRAADDQYRPGYGWGDKNHIHTGPPGLKRGSYNASDTGVFAPPPSNSPIVAGLTGDRTAWFVKTEVATDEQADYVISVVDSTGKALAITQYLGRPRSFVAGPLTGTERTVQSISYRVLIPRSVPIVLRLPASSVKPGGSYNIKIVATSPLGQSSTIMVPFTIPGKSK